MPGDEPAGALDAPGLWLQLGAFRQRAYALQPLQRALAQQRRVDLPGPLLGVRAEDGLHRARAGPWASRDEAQAAAEPPPARHAPSSSLRPA